MIGTIDIEIYDPTKDKFAQGKFLIHGYDDVYWTDDIKMASLVVKEEIKKILKQGEKYAENEK